MCTVDLAVTLFYATDLYNCMTCKLMRIYVVVLVG